MGKRQLTLKYLHIFTDCRGKLRAYFAPPGEKKIPLPLPVDSPEFLRAYTEAFEGKRNKTTAPKAAQPRDTFNELIKHYFASSSFSQLSASTKKNYRAVLEKFASNYGNLPVSQFSRRHAEVLLAKSSDRPEAANNLLKRLRSLLNFGVDIGIVTENPMRRMKGYKSSAEGYHTWTEAEIDRFIEQHPFGTKAYLALMLLLCTGQRRSDVVRMGWQDVSDGAISVRQQKTQTPLIIPIMPALAKALETLSKDAPAFLLTEQGRPFSVAGFGNWMRDRCNEAGLENCSAHGLRKACARRLAEAGCTHHEIKAITGHKTNAEVRRYTAKSDQAMLARSALGKLKRD